MSPLGMAVGAHHVALRDLGKQLLSAHQQAAPIRESEAFRARIAMIEVHAVRWKCAAAVGTRNSAKIAEEVQRLSLTLSDAGDLQVTMGGVIDSVVGALIEWHS
jgi:hypothetical protein